MPDDDPALPTPAEILTMHEEIEDEYDMKYTGVRVPAPKLRLREILQEAAAHDELFHRAAFLLRKLITAHLFEDGNKRTAWTVTQIYLERHDEVPAERGLPVERVLRRIRRYDVDELAEWLETGELDASRLEP